MSSSQPAQSGFFGRFRARVQRSPRWIEYELRRGRIDKNTYYDRLTEEVMRRVLRHDSVCVDAGCHAGSVLRTMLAIAPQGKFFAFEPLPDFHARLSREFSVPNIHLFQMALSDRKGRTSFNHVVSDPALSGIVRRGYFKEEIDESIEVDTDTLDGVLERFGSPPIRFVKVDVEGGELLVFRGARKTLSSNRPWIAFEHGLGASDYYGYGAPEVHELLVRDCGLKISLLADWLRGKPALTESSFHDNYREGRHFFYLAHP